MYELSRVDGPLPGSPRELIGVLLDWSRAQFEALGSGDAQGMALAFVNRLQGTSLLANALRGPTVVDRTVARLPDWIGGL